LDVSQATAPMKYKNFENDVCSKKMFKKKEVFSLMNPKHRDVGADEKPDIFVYGLMVEGRPEANHFGHLLKKTRKQIKNLNKRRHHWDRTSIPSPK
jgi:hypothetical protein